MKKYEKIKEKDEKMSFLYCVFILEKQNRPTQDEKDDKSWNIQLFQELCNKFDVGLEWMSVLKWILTPLTHILSYIYGSLWEF